VADLAAYMAINQRIDQEFLDRPLWNRKAILNTARSPKFSSDRTIREYAGEIWNLKSYPPDWVSFPLPQLYGEGECSENVIPDARAILE
jgi:starch phosphorylase